MKTANAQRISDCDGSRKTLLTREGGYLAQGLGKAPKAVVCQRDSMRAERDS